MGRRLRWGDGGRFGWEEVNLLRSIFISLNRIALCLILMVS